jgi:hypothetical protein
LTQILAGDEVDGNTFATETARPTDSVKWIFVFLLMITNYNWADQKCGHTELTLHSYLRNIKAW